MPITSLGQMAIEHIKALVEGDLSVSQPTTPSRAVARLVVMLHPYGASPKTILSAVHDMGWTDVTEEDVASAVDHLNTILPRA